MACNAKFLLAQFKCVLQYAGVRVVLTHSIIVVADVAQVFACHLPTLHSPRMVPIACSTTTLWLSSTPLGCPVVPLV